MLKKIELQIGKNQKKNGFTLLELLIAMIVFSIIAIAFVSLFLSAINQQRRVLAINNMINNTSYTLEYIDRAVRMAIKDATASGDCTGVASLKYNYGTSSSSTMLRFLNFDNKCVEFSLQNNKIMFRRSTDTNRSNLDAAEPLTSSDVKVSYLEYHISGDGQQDEQQPKVTITFISSPVNFKDINSVVQTTISQRNLDVPR